MGKKEIVIGILIFALFIGATYAVSWFSRPSAATSSVSVTFNKKAFIYFWGNTCPHCKELNDWMKENKITPEKLKMQKLEVYDNQKNAALMNKAAEVCGIPSTQVGVPFVYNNGKCYIGTDQVKEHFEQIN